MKTLAAQRALGAPSSPSPLASIRDDVLARVHNAEATRMAEARGRLRPGAGPLLSVLQKRIAEYSRKKLTNTAAPAVTRADLHTVLRAASKSEPQDTGLRRAAAHAYLLWSKSATGSLSVGDVARMREHYAGQFPRSRVAKVLDEEVPKVGFNTLPLAQLTRIAGLIQRAGGTQDAYEEAVTQYGLDDQTDHAFRCRAFIRSFIEGVVTEEDQASAPELAQRVQARLATDTDPVLSRFAQFALEEEESESEAQEFEPTEEAVDTIDSPVTGKPLQIELTEGEPDGVGAPITPDSAPLPQSMEVLGQLDDFASETTVVMDDPTDPEGRELEVTVRELDVPEEPLPMDSEPPLEAMATADDEPTCGSEHEHTAECYDKRAYVVYASVDGHMSADPIDTFQATGMAAALARIASYGVRGHVHGNPSRLADECYVGLDNGSFLHVVAETTELRGKDEAYEVDVNEQMPDAMPGVSADIIVGDQTMGSQAHPFEHLAGQVLDGHTAKRAGWELSIDNDANVSLTYQGAQKRKASLAELDNVVREFVQESAPAPAAAAPALHYAALRNTDTGRYVVVTDVPPGADLQYNARRMLHAVQEVIPAAEGTLRRDAKLQLNFSAGEPELDRVRRILEDRYRASEYRIEAQALDMPPSPGSAAEEGLVQPTPTDPSQLTQNSAVPPGTVVPVAQPGAPAPTAGGGAYVGPPAVAPAQTGQNAQAEFMATHGRVGFTVTYRGPDGTLGKAPVQARTAALARQLFERFNGADCRVVKVAQLLPEEADPMLPSPVEDMPGDPIGGSEDAILPVDDQLAGDPGLGDMPGGPMTGSLSSEEHDALQAALKHYRNLGMGPATALDKLMSEYSDLFRRHGDTTDVNRHEIEAEAMRVAAEVWTQPGLLEKEGQAVNTQQPDAVSVPSDLGPDSETDDAATNVLEVGKINSQVPGQAQPGTSASEASLGPDSETQDPGSFGVSKPVTQPGQHKSPGTSHSPMSGPAQGLGSDSETESKLTKSYDQAASNANDAVRSK